MCFNPVTKMPLGMFQILKWIVVFFSLNINYLEIWAFAGTVH